MLSAERDIRDNWCNSMQGIAEFRTKDGTYVYCLTEQYAVEVSTIIIGKKESAKALC